MAFANPLWLWGFSALIVPLTIHLLSRKEGKVIQMGSLRHLKDSNTQQFKSLRLNEIILFILRCLLIIIIVLFLSGLQWSKVNNQKWVIIEDALKNHSTAVSLKDSLVAKGYELHSLSNDLAIDDQTANHSYWSLAEQLKAKALSEVVIISALRAEAFKGTRISNNSTLKWINVPLATEHYTVAVIRKSNDSVTVINGYLENENTHYQRVNTGIIPNQKILKTGKDSVTIIPHDTLKIVVASDSEYSYDKRIVIALLKAIQKNTIHTLVIDESTIPLSNERIDTGWLIWLSDKPLPESKSVAVLSYKLNESSPTLHQESISQWTLSKRLNEELILNENISTQLAQILFPQQELWALANSKDQRTLSEKMMWSSASATSSTGIAKADFTPLDQYLIILFLLVWIAERIIAYKRNQ